MKKVKIICEECDGRGEVWTAPDFIFGSFYWAECENCRGKGWYKKWVEE